MSNEKLLLEAAELLEDSADLNEAAIEVLEWQYAVFKEHELTDFQIFLGPALGKLFRVAAVINPEWAAEIKER